MSDVQGAELNAWAQPKSGEASNAWTKTLSKATLAARTGVCASVVEGSGPKHLRAFVEPWVTVARDERRGEGTSTTGFDIGISASMLEELRQQLMDCARHVVDLDWNAFAAARSGPLSAWCEESAQPDQPASDAYADVLKKGGWERVLAGHPALARLACVRQQLWCTAQRELGGRLRRDCALLERSFGEGRALGPLGAVHGSLSDSHCGGRSVSELRFGSGVTLFYKPRSLAAEALYARLISWLSATGFPYEGRAARVLEREGYGWMEAVPALPCQSREEVSAYYRNAGALLALMHALGGCDMHFENLVAHTCYPVPVDLETLFSPRLFHEARSAPANARELASRLLRESVLFTSLLPNAHHLESSDDEPMDIGGLGTGRGMNRETQHLPHWDGAPVSPSSFVASIRAGFEDAYRHLMKQREAFTSEDCPLTNADDVPVRVIVRSTQTYRDLLHIGLEAGHTTSGSKRSLVLERLYAERDGEDAPDSWWRVLAAEMFALERGDVPFFVVRAGDTRLELEPEYGGGQHVELHGESPLAHARRRLRELDERDLVRQLDLIEATYRMADEDSPRREAVSFAQPVAPESADAAGIEHACVSELLNAAARIGERFEANAIRHAGTACWLAPEYHPPSGSYRIECLGPSLYGGLAGVAIFLSALAQVSEDPAIERLAREVVQSLLNGMARAEGAHLRKDARLGQGASGVVYALTRISPWLAWPELLDVAYELCAHFQRPVLEELAEDDVLEGVAGILLALLALHRATGKEMLLEQALDCGDLLLSRRKATPQGLPSWRSMGRFLTGFGHGAAGVARALSALATASGEDSFAQAALEAREYERTQWSSVCGNWLDLRPREATRGRLDPPPRVKAAATTLGIYGWCTGAPGVVLARLADSGLLDEAALHDVRDGLTSIQGRLLGQEADHLCCGNSSALEALSLAASRLERSDLRLLGQQAAMQLVRRAEHRGEFALRSRGTPAFTALGFWQGLAGIGYTLLRQMHSAELPSVLALE